MVKSLSGYRIHGYFDRGIFVVNLGCLYSSQILVNMFHGWDRGYHYISQQGETLSWVCENLLQYPRILYPLYFTCLPIP